MDNTEHTVLVAFDVGAPTRPDAMLAVQKALVDVPGTVVFEHGSHPCTIDSWWIAEDDRSDRSDNDSAVFVKPGTQLDAHRYLEFAGMAEYHGHYGVNANDHSAEADLTRQRIRRWTPEIPEDTVLDLLMRVAEDISRDETPEPDDVDRLRAMFSDDVD